MTEKAIKRYKKKKMKELNLGWKKYIIVFILLVLIVVVYFLTSYFYKTGTLFSTEGPGGCRSDECHEYCLENQEECEKWCQDNPESCDKIFKKVSKFPGMFKGPGDCRSDEECKQYCMQNIEECHKWCEDNQDKCPEEMKQIMDLFGGDVTGPGGCKVMECQEYCQQNFIECQDWCLENPNEGFCKLLFGAFEKTEMIEEVADPPKTAISYAKSVNFFVGQPGQDVEEKIIEIKRLGANMITIWPTRFVKDDEIIFNPANIPQIIDLAHKNGLQIELRNSIIFPDLVKDYEKYKVNAIEHAAEYAKFAEKYKVYRIVPFGEIDNDMMNKCDKISELAGELLSEMRKYYSGKIGVGVVGFWRDCGFTFKGYDYLTVSAYPHNELASSINWARKVADRSDIKILHVGETGVFNPGDGQTPDEFQTTILDKSQEAVYYQDFFDKFSNKIDGISVFYTGKNNAMSIYGDPAELVVKGWYHKL